ncbi:MAG: type II secretion system major pseudopilin GspG [Gammaproteobacteria bacterium]|nr:type II secretion system major pseudopilin GspG [Gammaproteobacteria bacterium]MCP4090495.1 type II secretion system major pseudopilin GspG [Gammaproteobacteria bacterium]MCP4831390.1 type II secretion system major pseudopilin GspG [Gammaproteobacteria bacterium]MCP4927934.1 type II secretion system major pseudopilin GspG [Gammaproteobacteria bacterium]
MKAKRTVKPTFQRSRQSGFTLIEIMVVVIIIGILISMVGTNIFPALEEAEVTASEFQLKQIENSLSMYRMKNARYPTSEEGLQALVTPPGGETRYMDSIPKDSWGNEYNYRSPGQNGDYDLYSLGRDGQEGGEGIDADIGNWQAE